MSKHRRDMGPTLSDRLATARQTNGHPFGIAGLDRCADCRKVCACTGDCQCMAHTVSEDWTALLCHSCTDARERVS